MNIKVERVTPAKAREYLDQNTQNRPIRPNVVQRYARAIDHNEWLDNGEAIKFNGDGTLVDGQHRLAAVIESGKTIELLVVRGVAPQAAETMDTGVTRRPSDMLAIRGYENSDVLAGIGRATWNQKGGGKVILTRTGTGANPQEVLREVERGGPKMVNMAAWASEYAEKNPELGVNAMMFGEIAYNAGKLNGYDKVKEFFEGVEKGEGDLPKLLRSTLIEYRGSQRNYSRTHRMAIVIKAFNAWMLDTKLRALIWKRSGSKNNREAFPVLLGTPPNTIAGEKAEKVLKKTGRKKKK